MKIKSLDELKIIREKSAESITTRINDKVADYNQIEIMIGTATCGILRWFP